MTSTSTLPGSVPAHIDAPRSSANDTPANTDTTTTAQDRKRKRNATATHTLYASTLRQRTWTYMHLRLLTPSLLTTPSAPTDAAPAPEDSLDAPTIHTLLAPPLSAYLGITGLSIPIDVLRARGRDAWVRIPARDARGVKAALAGWVGSADGDAVPGAEGGGRVRVAWRVVGEAGTVGGLLGGGDGGESVFE